MKFYQREHHDLYVLLQMLKNNEFQHSQKLSTTNCLDMYRVKEYVKDAQL